MSLVKRSRPATVNVGESGATSVGPLALTGQRYTHRLNQQDDERLKRMKPNVQAKSEADNLFKEWHDAIQHVFNHPVFHSTGMQVMSDLVAEYSEPLRYHVTSVGRARDFVGTSSWNAKWYNRYHAQPWHSFTYDMVHDLLVAMEITSVTSKWWSTSMLKRMIATRLANSTSLAFYVGQNESLWCGIDRHLEAILEFCVHKAWITVGRGRFPVYDPYRRDDFDYFVDAKSDGDPPSIQCPCLYCGRSQAIVSNSTCHHVVYCLRCVNTLVVSATLDKCPCCSQPVEQWNAVPPGCTIWIRPDHHPDYVLPFTDKRMCVDCKTQVALVENDRCHHLVYCRKCVGASSAHWSHNQCPDCRVAVTQWNYSPKLAFRA